MSTIAPHIRPTADDANGWTRQPSVGGKSLVNLFILYAFLKAAWKAGEVFELESIGEDGQFGEAADEMGENEGDLQYEVYDPRSSTARNKGTLRERLLARAHERNMLYKYEGLPDARHLCSLCFIERPVETGKARKGKGVETDNAVKRPVKTVNEKGIGGRTGEPDSA